MAFTTMKEILAPLSSASDAMSNALQQAQEQLSGGVSDASSSVSKGVRRSLSKAQKSADRARNAWYERTDMVRDRSSDAADQAAATYRNALDALSSTWNRAMKAIRAAGDQVPDIDVRRETERYSRQSATWARKNPHIVAAAVAVAGYLVIRSYRKRKQRRLDAEEVTGEVGDAANDEAVHTQRSA